MTNPLMTPRWHEAVATLLRGGGSVAHLLCDLLDVTVAHDGICLLAFHNNAAPDIMHHTLDADGARHYLDRYLAGPYLLDPLYELATRARVPALCRFRDEAPDRFRRSEYYRQYCNQTHLTDEVDILLRVSDRTTLVVVIGRRGSKFLKSELQRLSLVQPIVTGALGKLWEELPAARGRAQRKVSVHRRLLECFEQFGADELTERERATTRLLLRGYSTKAIARELDIAPGTVMVHKRNLFAKLGIKSQNELFSRFLASLSDAK